ncbi:MAG: VOC family protein [Acidimicrobiia bacterium]
MTRLRRLDHVAILVRDTDQAILAFSGRLGLSVVYEEMLADPPVRLTYLDVGNAYVQLVEPLDGSSDLARQLQIHGEGLHHVCFGVDDVPAAIAALSAPDRPPPLGQGRGRVSGFVGNGLVHGVRLECTEFRHDADVERSPGWVA